MKKYFKNRKVKSGKLKNAAQINVNRNLEYITSHDRNFRKNYTLNLIQHKSNYVGVW